MFATSGRRWCAPLEALTLEGGERLEGEIKYYDYGVVSVVYQLSFSGDWESLIDLASRWVWGVDFAARIEPIVRQRLERVPDAMVKPYTRWLSEDYFIFHVREKGQVREKGDAATAADTYPRARARDCANCSRRSPCALDRRMH